MMGAALADQGLDAATLLTTNMLDDDDHRFYKWEDFYKAYKMPPYQTAPCAAATIKLCEMLEKEVGYKFRYPRLAQSAFLHSSIPSSWDKTPSYQRLEFLGDSVLDMVCIRYMYEKYPKFGPGWLTEHKAGSIMKLSGLLLTFY
jgi:endoribonuclease Dicer